MRQLKSGFAFVLSLIMVVSLLGTMLGLPVKAEGEETVDISFTLGLSLADGTSAPENYGFYYSVMESDGVHSIPSPMQGGIDKSTGNETYNLTVPADSVIQLSLTNPGLEVLSGDNVTNDFDSSKNYRLDEINGQTISLQLRQRSGGTSPTMRTIEFAGASSIEDGKAVYTFGEGEAAQRVTVAISEGAVTENSGHKEIQVEESKLSTVSFSFTSFDADNMQAVIRGGDGYQQVLTVSDGSASLSGLTLPGGMVNFSVEPKSSSGPETPPAGAEVSVKVSWNGEFGYLELGGTRISGVNIEDSPVLEGESTVTAHLESDDTISIKLQAMYLQNYNSIKINDVEKFTTATAEGDYTFKIPKDDIPMADGKLLINIQVNKSVSTKHTIVWAYDDSMGWDAKVENGTVEVLDGVVENNPMHCVAEEGERIKVKLIPAYGYQVVGARINGDVDLTACSGTNEFEFVMPPTNVHFQGIFTKTADIVNCSADAVASASLGNGSAVAGDGGSAKMTVSSGTAADTSNVTTGSVDETKSVQAVNITMEQVFFKNTADSVWSTTKSELSGNAEVRLQVNQQAEGYAVLREHGGQITQIPASYDPETKMLIFASNQYSNYTLVPLTEANNEYTPEDPENGDEGNEGEDSGKQETPSETTELVSSDNTQEEQIKKLEQQETEKEIQTVVVDTTGVTDETEQLVPQETFNLSEIKTVKGFVSAMQKVLEKSEKLAYVTATTTEPKPVSIYTEKPVCFNKTVAAAFTNAKMDIVYYFTYKGHLFSVTIPAGTDLKAIFDKVPYAGPLYIGYVLGTSQIIL